VGNIPHSRGELNFGHLNELTVPCYVDEVSPRLGLWGLVLALCWLVCLLLVCGVVLARGACVFVVGLWS
jgi:hypothetical protein